MTPHPPASMIIAEKLFALAETSVTARVNRHDSGDECAINTTVRCTLFRSDGSLVRLVHEIQGLNSIFVGKAYEICAVRTLVHLEWCFQERRILFMQVSSRHLVSGYRPGVRGSGIELPVAINSKINSARTYFFVATLPSARSPDMLAFRSIVVEVQIYFRSGAQLAFSRRIVCSSIYVNVRKRT